MFTLYKAQEPLNVEIYLFSLFRYLATRSMSFGDCLQAIVNNIILHAIDSNFNIHSFYSYNVSSNYFIAYKKCAKCGQEGKKMLPKIYRKGTNFWILHSKFTSTHIQHVLLLKKPIVFTMLWKQKKIFWTKYKTVFTDEKHSVKK